MPMAAMAIPVPSRERRGPPEATTSGVDGLVGSKDGSSGGFQPGRSSELMRRPLDSRDETSRHGQCGHGPRCGYEDAERDLTSPCEIRDVLRGLGSGGSPTG